MFDSLKKKLKESAKKLAEKVSKEEKAEVVKKPPKKVKKPKVEKPKIEVPKPEIPEKIEKPEVLEKVEKKVEVPEEKIEEVPEEVEKPEEIEEVPEKRGLRARLVGKVVERELPAEDIDKFFQEIETGLLQANVALEVIEAFKDGLKKELAGKKIKRTKAGEAIQKAFETSLFEIVEQKPVDLKGIIKRAKSESRPAVFVFLGFNGTGKSLSLAKFAKFLADKGYKPLLAAGDTFRSAGIEQLEAYAEPLGVKVVKHERGADSCAVIFDTIKAAKAQDYDVVLADTAGRSHADVNLLDELKKIVRVNKPDLKILVLDSLAGNDIISQTERFNEAVGVDAMILTKLDVNKKGGSILSASHVIKKPILFLGTGQRYEDWVEFKPKEFVKQLLGF